MIIKFTPHEPHKKFAELKPGDVFVHPVLRTYLMKMTEEPGVTPYNAVSIGAGNQFSMEPDDTVIPDNGIVATRIQDYIVPDE